LICLDHENFDLGMEIVDVGLKYKPDSGRLRVYRGVLLVMKGDIEQAEREFETARTLGPGGPAPDIALAMAWIQSGDASKAVDLLRARRKGGAREAVVPYMLGIALMRTGVDPAAPDGAEAIGAFEEAIRLDPALAGPRAELGKALLRRGDTGKAIEQLERATSLDPDNPAPLYLLGQAYRKMGNTARAQELLARVTKLNEQGRSDDPDKELKRIVVRIVREGAAPAPPK
jgi:Flp pilus assembly protein TadD